MSGIDEFGNNAITGTWSSVSVGGSAASGQRTDFFGTITATARPLAQSHIVRMGGVSPTPVNVSGGWFTFNGPIESFTGWSFGVTGAAGVSAEYQMTLDGYYLVMVGTTTGLEVSGGVGHTTVSPNGLPGSVGGDARREGLTSNNTSTPPSLAEVMGQSQSKWNEDGTKTYTYDDPISGERVSTRAIVDPVTGQVTLVYSTVSLQGAEDPLLGGNTYPAAAVRVGYELNALDRISEESHARNGGAGVGGTLSSSSGPTIGARGSEGGDARREGGGRDDDRGSGGGYSNTGNNPGNPNAGGYHGGGTTTGGGYSNTGNNPGNPNAGGYHGGGTTSGNSNGTGSSSHDHTATEDRRPILLDLDGDGIEITELSKSTVFTDTSGDGLDHRTAWAGAGDGVLFIDADGNGQLSNSHEFVFTEWADGAKDVLDGLRRAVGSNGEGRVNSDDPRSFSHLCDNRRRSGRKTLAQQPASGDLHASRCANWGRSVSWKNGMLA